VSRKSSTPFAQNVQIACVTIDYNHYLLPMSKALKVMELLNGAVKCERTYDLKRDYQLSGQQVDLQMSMVKHSQIFMRDAKPAAGTLALGYDDGN
jgi:hypothetical protein